MDFRDYRVRVWDDGDVGFSCYDHLCYGQTGGLSGLQCNCDEDDPLYAILSDNFRDVANAMRALDETLVEIERRSK